MPRQKYHRQRVYQVVGEPGPGSIAVGYVRYSSELQDPTTIATQKRRIQEFAEKKGWKIVRWYEEPEQSAKYEEIEQRPIFAQLLSEARKQFQIVICYMNNRWSRNVVVAFTSLTRLRQVRAWWATADGLWDIDKVQQDGFDVAFAVDTQINASYVRQLSKRTIDGKEDRARDGYHNGWVSFGYLPPDYPKAPDGAPSTWRPPRMLARPDPINFPALVRIGELAAQGWSDLAIADELDDYISRTSRFGERPLTKDTIAAIRRSWFPREFAPGCGHGTIDTPSVNWLRAVTKQLGRMNFGKGWLRRKLRNIGVLVKKRSEDLMSLVVLLFVQHVVVLCVSLVVMISPTIETQVKYVS